MKTYKNTIIFTRKQPENNWIWSRESGWLNARWVPCTRHDYDDEKTA